MKLSKRTLLAIGTFAALLPFGVAGAEAAGLTSPMPVAGSGLTTPLDATISLIVQQRVAAGKLSAAEAGIAREQLQLQYLAMPAAARQRVQEFARTATSQEGVAAVAQLLNTVVAEAARQQADEARNAQIAALPGSKQAAGGMMQKLGADGDLVFVATAGPCRVADTRLNLYSDWPGPVAGFTGRQIWAFSWFGGYDFNSEQGGTGVAGSGNCLGTVFPTTWPTSVVATVAVVNTSSTGYLRAWNGGTTLTVGGILGWNAGDVLSNTTVIPLNRSIAAYPGSGPFKRDFAVYNNSGNPVDVIVDVVGYFIENRATALDCTTVSGPGFTLAAGDSQLYSAPACPTGYTPVVAQPVTNVYGVDAGTLFEDACRISNYTGTSKGVNCSARCCRIPGR
jgi:hypothetical protein